MAQAHQRGETNSVLRVKEAETITKLDVITPRASCAGQPRARGTVRLSSKQIGTRSVLDRLFQSGSARCLFPRVSGTTFNAVFLNTSGGVTGGDKIDFSATVGAGSSMTLTTQACERVYKAQPNQIGQVRNTLHVKPGARLNWMPQETILFNASALDRRLHITLEDDAQLLMVEPVVFGRAAMGERLTSCTYRDRIEITRNAEPIYIDAARMSGDVATHLAQRHIASDAGAMASVVLIAPNAEAHLNAVRALLPETAGASILRQDMLVLRVLAGDSFALRQVLLPVLRLLNNTEIPRCWMI